MKTFSEWMKETHEQTIEGAADASIRFGSIDHDFDLYAKEWVKDCWAAPEPRTVSDAAPAAPMIDDVVVLNAITKWEGGKVDREAWRKAVGVRVTVTTEGNMQGHANPVDEDGKVMRHTSATSRLLGIHGSAAEIEAYDVGMILIRFARYGVPEAWWKKWCERFGYAAVDKEKSDVNDSK